MTPEHMTTVTPFSNIGTRVSRHNDCSMPAAAFALTAMVMAVGNTLGGEWKYFAFKSTMVLPLAVLAVLAYLGAERRWARALTFVLLAMILLYASRKMILQILYVLVPESRAQPDLDFGLMMSSLRIPQFALVCGGIGLAILMATSALIPRVRQLLARLLPIDPHSFVHTVALVAVVVAVVAGIGEELAVRGVLQPQLGLFLSNLFFTALHAMQYNWDNLFSVFVSGLVYGVIRKKANTTTSAIAHGTIDFLLIMGFLLVTG